MENGQEKNPTETLHTMSPVATLKPTKFHARYKFCVYAYESLNKTAGLKDTTGFKICSGA